MNPPKFDLLKALEAACSKSEAVIAAEKARNLFALLFAAPAKRQKAGYQPLTAAQLKVLQSQGNTAEDWKQVWVGKGFDPKRVNRCHFAGPVLLSSCSGTVSVEGAVLPTGLSHATLSHCVVGENVFIRNVRLLNRTVLNERAVLFDVGVVTIDGTESFANGSEILIAIETGGREVPLFAELTIDGAWVLTRSRGDKKLIEGVAKGIEKYLKQVSAPCNVIGPSATILHTPKVVGVLLGEAAHIDAAQLVAHATVLSNVEEATEISHGAIVKNSVLQWGCEVTSEAIVDTSLLVEHSHVERHGKVTHSILGPNTGVAEGEVTSALLGPFVGFHHQALLIAALWPEGKGNVGYGANVGSNHTAKAPDQEIWPGEGTFFGLGVNIKFPTDLTQSPYTIIASGATLLPQKVEFPFSLINTPAAAYAGVSPAYMEIMPGWVLSDNIYMVRRNEGKYQKRNKAKRSTFDFEVFRPDIVDMMVDARQRLLVKEVKDYYTSKEIKGLGKNVCLEGARKKGIEAYTFYIRYYALLGFKRELEAVISKNSSNPKETAKKLLASTTGSPRWEHERGLLSKEFPGAEPAQLLEELVRMQERIAADVQSSKEKDDKRGAEVIEDYPQAHKPASQDSFIKETWAVTEKLKQDVQRLLAAVGKTASAGKGEFAKHGATSA